MRSATEILPNVISTSDARNILEVLRSGSPSSDASESASFVDCNGRKAKIPEELCNLFITILDNIECGSGVTVMPLGMVLTTAEAAEVLNVSRPHVVKLLESGEIPFHKVGTHRRILLSDLVKFRDKRQQRFSEAMLRIYDVTEELDLPR